MTISTTHDIVPDSPTNNFATLNAVNTSSTSVSLSEGNLSCSIAANHTGVVATHGVSSGKWYWEFNAGSASLNAYYTSICDTNNWSAPSKTQADMYSSPYVWTYYGNTGGKINNGTATAYGSSYTSGHVIGVFLDADAGTITFYKNNVSQGTAFTGLSGNFAPWFGNGSSGTSVAGVYNFGQDPSFGGATGLPTPPSGSPFPDSAGYGSFYFKPVDSNGNDLEFYSLCTANLPDPDIDPAVDDLPEDYFKAVKYIGNDTTNTSVPAVGFNPDFIWVKNISSAAGHALTNSVQGFDKLLISNGTNSEISTTAFSVSSNGFSVSGGDGKINASGFNYVAWCWKAGGSPSATDDGTGVSGSAKLVDTSGTASSTTCKSFKDAAVTAGASNVKCPSKMSINQKAGFSIVKYVGDGSTGSTVPHGLSQAPQMIIVKPLNGTTTYGWRIYTEMTGNTKYLNLDNTDPANTYTDWNNTSPTSSVFTVNSSSAQTNNESGTDYIAYCWHSVAGYSAFGSYTGNGSADGPFIYTGFKPAWVMVKATNLTGSSWFVWDNQRSPHNEMVNALLPNDSLQELTDREIDFLSNGFKPRANDGNYNQNYTYIYAAFAEQPFKYATAR